MADPANLLNLPVGLLSSADPVSENPFRENNPRHYFWETATRDADEKVARLNSAMLQTFSGNPDEGVAWWVELVLGRFDIWAERNIHVVWSEAERQAYDKWLPTWANALLETAGAFSMVLAPEALLEAVRLPLIARLEHWKAEGLRYVAEQRLHKIAAPDSAVAVPVLPKRGELVRPKLDTARIEAWISDQGYTNELLAVKLGTGVRVISSIRSNGKHHGTPALTKLAKLMGCEFGSDLYLG